jgi:serine protease Do
MAWFPPFRRAFLLGICGAISPLTALAEPPLSKPSQPIAVTAPLATPPIPLTQQHTSRRDELVEVVDRVKASVVNIHSERTVTETPDDPFRMRMTQPQRVNGMGTGIVLDPRGYIVTNFHVVDDVLSLKVRLVDGTTCTARIISTDKESDLALIKIDPPKPLPLVPLGTAQDLMLAEKVIAIGNAYGYEHTVTIGHVSAMKRDVTLNKEISYKSLIQTQTPINPGNSGGPLFNKLGEVVGVNVAIRAGAQNIAFAIPVDTMIAKSAEMLSGKKRPGYRLGVTLDDEFERDTEDGPLRRWVRVQRVDDQSPASQAGVKAGDLLEKVGDQLISTSMDVERAMVEKSVGSKLALKVKRGSEVLALETTLSGQITERASLAVTATADPLWTKVGIKVQPIGANAVAAIDRQLRGGLYISEVAIGSNAARAGLQRGDVLIGMHQWETLTSENALFVIGHKDLATFNPLKAFIIREGRIREVVLTIQ